MLTLKSQNSMLETRGCPFNLDLSIVMEMLEEGKPHHQERTSSSQTQPRKRQIQSWTEGRQMQAFYGPSEIYLDLGNLRVFFFFFFLIYFILFLLLLLFLL